VTEARSRFYEVCDTLGITVIHRPMTGEIDVRAPEGSIFRYWNLREIGVWYCTTETPVDWTECLRALRLGNLVPEDNT
jgi:hypothetical protein